MEDFDPILYRAVSETLFMLSVPAHMDGFSYLAEAIEMTVMEPSRVHGIMKYIYPEVAKKFGSTPSRVERSIRNAIETACARARYGVFDEYFGNVISPETGKPTIAMFIATVAQKIRVSLILNGSVKK